MPSVTYRAVYDHWFCTNESTIFPYGLCSSFACFWPLCDAPLPDARCTTAGRSQLIWNCVDDQTHLPAKLTYLMFLQMGKIYWYSYHYLLSKYIMYEYNKNNWSKILNPAARVRSGLEAGIQSVSGRLSVREDIGPYTAAHQFRLRGPVVPVAMAIVANIGPRLDAFCGQWLHTVCCEWR